MTRYDFIDPDLPEKTRTTNNTTECTSTVNYSSENSDKVGREQQSEQNDEQNSEQTGFFSLLTNKVMTVFRGR